MTLIDRISELITSIGSDIKSIYGRVLPSGGTTGQVLKKTSGTDYAVAWQDESGGGGGVQNLFIQEEKPNPSVKSLWIDTSGDTARIKILTP